MKPDNYLMNQENVAPTNGLDNKIAWKLNRIWPPGIQHIQGHDYDNNCHDFPRY